MEWQALSDGLPEEKQLVLLHWPIPDMPPIYRLGTLLYKPYPTDMPIWKLDLDYGVAGAWVYTGRDDKQPTHWMPLPAAPTTGSNPS